MVHTNREKVRLREFAVNTKRERERERDEKLDVTCNIAYSGGSNDTDKLRNMFC